MACISPESRIICFGGYVGGYVGPDWETDEVAEYASAQRCKISFIIIIAPFLHFLDVFLEN